MAAAPLKDLAPPSSLLAPHNHHNMQAGREPQPQLTMRHSVEDRSKNRITPGICGKCLASTTTARSSPAPPLASLPVMVVCRCSVGVVSSGVRGWDVCTGTCLLAVGGESALPSAGSKLLFGFAQFLVCSSGLFDVPHTPKTHALSPCPLSGCRPTFVSF